MKVKLLALVFFATIILAASLAQAEESSTAPELSGFGVTLGYKNVSVNKDKFEHDTHKDDSFMPESGKKGSAGDTSIDFLHFISFGIRYQLPVSQYFLINIDAGGLGGWNRDRHKNDNDSRPGSNASFVYSESNWGVYSELGMSYRVNKQFYVGADAQIAGVWVESGWDRWGKDEKDEKKFLSAFLAGPKVGYIATENLGFEGIVQFGRKVNFTTQIVFLF